MHALNFELRNLEWGLGEGGEANVHFYEKFKINLKPCNFFLHIQWIYNYHIITVMY